MGVESQKLMKACQDARKSLKDNQEGPAHQLKSLAAAVARLAQKIKKNPDPKSWTGDNSSVVSERTFTRNSIETLFARSLDNAVKAAADLDKKIKKKEGWRSFFTEQKDLPAAQAELKLIQAAIKDAKGKMTKYGLELKQLEEEAEEVLSGVPKVDPRREQIKKLLPPQVKKLIVGLAKVKSTGSAEVYTKEVHQLVRGIAAAMGKVAEWASFRSDWSRMSTDEFLKGVTDGDPAKEKAKEVEAELKQFLPHLDD